MSDSPASASVRSPRRSPRKSGIGLQLFNSTSSKESPGSWSPRRSPRLERKTFAGPTLTGISVQEELRARETNGELLLSADTSLLRGKRRASTSVLMTQSYAKLQSEKEDAGFINKKLRRYSLAPGKSCLKISSTKLISESENRPSVPSLNSKNDNASTTPASVDIVFQGAETFNFNAWGLSDDTNNPDEIQDIWKSRKSIGRRVSFAATAHVRLFEKDESEENTIVERQSEVPPDDPLSDFMPPQGSGEDEAFSLFNNENFTAMGDLSSIRRMSGTFPLAPHRVDHLGSDEGNNQTINDGIKKVNVSIHSECSSERSSQRSFEMPVKDLSSDDNHIRPTSLTREDSLYFTDEDEQGFENGSEDNLKEHSDDCSDMDIIDTEDKTDISTNQPVISFVSHSTEGDQDEESNRDGKNLSKRSIQNKNFSFLSDHYTPNRKSTSIYFLDSQTPAVMNSTFVANAQTPTDLIDPTLLVGNSDTNSDTINSMFLNSENLADVTNDILFANLQDVEDSDSPHDEIIDMEILESRFDNHRHIEGENFVSHETTVSPGPTHFSKAEFGLLTEIRKKDLNRNITGREIINYNNKSKPDEQTVLANCSEDDNIALLKQNIGRASPGLNKQYYSVKELDCVFKASNRECIPIYESRDNLSFFDNRFDSRQNSIAISAYTNGDTMSFVDELTGGIKDDVNPKPATEEALAIPLKNESHRNYPYSSAFNNDDTMSLIDDINAGIKSFGDILANEQSNYSPDTVEKGPFSSLITMKEFLGKFDIFFMDQLPIPQRRQTMIFENGEPKFVDYVKAIAVFRPQIEMYESNCKFLTERDDHLRRKISEFEQDEDNQSLLQDYLNAPLDVQQLIKQRFRLIKTYCRLAATKEWYEWREAHVDGVKKRLEENLMFLKKDNEIIKNFSDVEKFLPKLRSYHQDLRKKLRNAEARRKSISQCDQEQLFNMKEAVEEQNVQIAKFQDDLDKLNSGRDLVYQKLCSIKKKKNLHQEGIEKARNLAERSNCYSKDDIKEAQGQYRNLLEQHLWKPVLLSANFVEMLYDEHLHIKVNIDVIRSRTREMGVEIHLINKINMNPKEQEYYTIILSCLKSTTSKYASLIGLSEVSKIFHEVKTFWQKAKLLYHEIRALRFKCDTTILAFEDENGGKLLCLRPVFFSYRMRTKFYINFMFQPKDLLCFPALDHVQWDLRLEYGTVDDKNQKVISDVISKRFLTGTIGAVKETCVDIMQLVN